jgi:hypothetical protein
MRSMPDKRKSKEKKKHTVDVHYLIAENYAFMR